MVAGGRPVLVKLLTLIGLVAIMLAMGLRVKLDEVVASARRPWQVTLSLLANFVLVPALTTGLLYLFAPEPLVSVGFLIVAVCPGAPVGPPFAAIAKGDEPFAVGQMVILAGLSAFLSPALLGVILNKIAPESDLHIDYLAIVQNLLIAQILPLALGLAIGRRAPEFARRVAGPVGSIANVLLLGVVALLLFKEYEFLASIRLRGWTGMLVLWAVSLGIGWICGGPARETRKSLAVTTAARNAAVALVIVSANFPDTPALTAVVAYAFVCIFATLGSAFVLGAFAQPTQS
jgi:BASS family bile acid:Na+ symporter